MARKRGLLGSLLKGIFKGLSKPSKATTATRRRNANKQWVNGVSRDQRRKSRRMKKWLGF